MYTDIHDFQRMNLRINFDDILTFPPEANEVDICGFYPMMHKCLDLHLTVKNISISKSIWDCAIFVSYVKNNHYILVHTTMISFLDDFHFFTFQHFENVENVRVYVRQVIAS